MILLSSLYFLMILAVSTCHTIKFPSSSPDAKYCPHGDTEMERTHEVWNLYSMETAVGKGFRSEGCGSSGISLVGSSI